VLSFHFSYFRFTFVALVWQLAMRVVSDKLVLKRMTTMTDLALIATHLIILIRHHGDINHQDRRIIMKV
jgi:hypothetical protein